MPSPKITANEFITAFQSEWNSHCTVKAISGIAPFDNRAAWTRMMQDRDGFLHRVMQRLVNQNRRLEYKTEWYSVDALYVGGDDIYLKNLSYPSEVHALIEHEFNEDLETEMWKLIHWRAPLKVIISYDWAVKDKTTDQRRNYLSDKVAKLRSMLDSVNIFHSESSETEYVFLIASRVTHNGPITWVRV